MWGFGGGWVGAVTQANHKRRTKHCGTLRGTFVENYRVDADGLFKIHFDAKFKNDLRL